MAIIKLGKGVNVRKINDDSLVDAIHSRITNEFRADRKRWLRSLYA